MAEDVLAALAAEFPDFGIAVYQYVPTDRATAELYRGRDGAVVIVARAKGDTPADALAGVLGWAREEFAAPPPPDPEPEAAPEIDIFA